MSQARVDGSFDPTGSRSLGEEALSRITAVDATCPVDVGPTWAGPRCRRGRTRRWRPFVGVAALFIVLQGCAGSERPTTEVTVVGGETAADPFGGLGFAMAGNEVTADAPSLTVRAGEEVTITFENVHGQYSPTSGIHNLAVVPRLEDLATLAATGGVLDLVLWEAVTPELVSGASHRLTFTPDVPGDYLYICTIPGHAADGMSGDFVVTQ